MNITHRDMNQNLPEQVEPLVDSSNRAAEIFADPVGYLASLGIAAEQVTITDTGLALPVAA